MKRKYEAIIVLNTKGKEEGVDSMVKNVRDQIEGEGAVIESVTPMGRRKFAFNARHVEGGFYVSCLLDTEPDSLGRIQNRLKLNQDISLQHFQRVG